MIGGVQRAAFHRWYEEQTGESVFDLSHLKYTHSAELAWAAWQAGGEEAWGRARAKDEKQQPPTGDPSDA